MRFEQRLGQLKKKLTGKAGVGLWPCCLAACAFFLQLLPACQRPAAEAAKTLVISTDTTLYGMFAYMADAAIFIRCSDGSRFPVAMEEKFGQLERGYLQLVGEEAGRSVLLACHGRLVSRPAAEEGRGERLLVDTVYSLSTELDCRDRPVRWEGKYWRQQEESLFLPCGSDEALRISGGITELALRMIWEKNAGSVDETLYVDMEGVKKPDGWLYPTRILTIAVDNDCP